MTRDAFLLLMVALAAAILLAMWLGWRARKRRDAGVAVLAEPLSGRMLLEIPKVAYVSTTPLGRPFERIAIPGLIYKGYAELRVRTDGAEIEVTGEPPVRIGAAQLLGTGMVRGRIGKVVERDGLAVLQWQPAGERVLESSFRFDEPAQQQQFAATITQVTDAIKTTPGGAT